MNIGKRNQPRRLTPTPVGPIRPSDGLEPSHARAALRFTAKGDGGNAVPQPPRSQAHVCNAVRLMIGCARRAGMGSVRAVADAARAILTTVIRGRGDVARAARASVEAAASIADDELTIDRDEAVAVAALAAMDVARGTGVANRHAVRRAVADAAIPSDTGQPVARIIAVRPPAEPGRCRELAADAVRQRVREGRPVPPAPAELVSDATTCLEAAATLGHPPRRSIRDVAHALVRSGHHRGRDVGRIARAVVHAALRSARRLGLTRAEAAGQAAAHAVDAGHALGRHAFERVWDAVALPARARPATD